MAEDPRFNGAGPDASFWQALNNGKFLLQHCGPCALDYFPPALVCPRCGNTETHWHEPSGNGTVYASTTVRDRAGDYNVSIVELEGGARMMTRVEGVAPDEVRIGQAVEAQIVPGEKPHVVFTRSGIQS